MLEHSLLVNVYVPACCCVSVCWFMHSCLCVHARSFMYVGWCMLFGVSWCMLVHVGECWCVIVGELLMVHAYCDAHVDVCKLVRVCCCMLFRGCSWVWFGLR